MEDALRLLENVGDLIYLTSQDETSRKVILLDPKWIVYAMSCVIDKTEQWHEKINTSCPLISRGELTKLWKTKPRMREALRKSRSNNMNDDSFNFILDMMESVGLVFRFDSSDIKEDSDTEISPMTNQEEENEPIYFLPTQLTDCEPQWNYRSRETWRISLAQAYTTNTNKTWDSGTTLLTMNDFMLHLLGDFSTRFPNIFKSNTRCLHHSPSVYSDPLPQSCICQPCEPSCYEAENKHNDDMLQIRLIQCWKSFMIIKFRHRDYDNQLPVSDDVEVFVHFEQQCNALRESWYPQQQRLILSARGPEKYEGKSIWKGGYEFVQDSVERYLEKNWNPLQ
jgi:hypothetical protein